MFIAKIVLSYEILLVKLPIRTIKNKELKSGCDGTLGHEEYTILETHSVYKVLPQPRIILVRFTLQILHQGQKAHWYKMLVSQMTFFYCSYFKQATILCIYICFMTTNLRNSVIHKHGKHFVSLLE